MRIFITGSTGFIGRQLVPLLGQHELLLIGSREACFSQSNISYIRADLADPVSWEKEVENFAPDACIHLAWKGLPDYSFKACLENFDMSTRLFEFLSLKGCKKIFAAGTCFEYGTLQGAVKEGDSSQNLSLFASFKAGLRLVGESLAAGREIDFIWGRFFFVYGVGQRETSLIPSCYSSLAGGRQPAVKNPKAVCDFIHVADVASAIKALIETEGTRGTFNIGSGLATEVSRVCGYVAQALRAKYEISGAGNLSEGSGFWADISLINARTGWKPRISIQKGVEDTMLELKKR